MYTRAISEKRASPIENGAPVEGTWTQAFDKVDLSEIKKPYRFPLPRWLRDNRIKEWESFIIQDSRFYLEAILANFKLIRTAQVFFYDKEAKERYTYRKIIPGTGWRLPKSLSNAMIESRSYGFFFRIHSWLDAGMVRIDLNIKARRKRPALTAHAAFSIGEAEMPSCETPDAGTPQQPLGAALVTVSGFSERRCMYAYKALSPVRGDLVFGGRHIILNSKESAGFFCDYKGIFPYRMRQIWCAGTGIDQEGRRFGFHLAENQIRESRKNNENALWLEGRVCPLPPVRITESGESEWIIQDLEGMVDLVFTAKEPQRFGLSLLAASADFETPMGIYNGTLVNAEGKEIQVRNIWGMGKKLYLRV